MRSVAFSDIACDAAGTMAKRIAWSDGPGIEREMTHSAAAVTPIPARRAIANAITR